MGKSLAAVALALALMPGCSASRETARVEVDPAAIVRADADAPNACGPAAILDALRFGDAPMRAAFDGVPGTTSNEKLRAVIGAYGQRDSVVTPGLKLFGADRGMMAEDLLPFANAILADQGGPPLAGGFADRLDGEPTADHLRRIHARFSTSLAAGIPVVTSIRSFAAQEDPADGRTKWEGVAAHCIAVTSVPKVLAPQQKGFAFEFADPWSGAIQEGYAYVEEVRGFQAVKGSDSKRFEWLGKSSFLLVVLPSLDLDTSSRPWHARSFMTLNYTVGRFER